MDFHLFFSPVATPKQIRDFMKVDGLTNDEVKSHLQVSKYETFLTSIITNHIIFITAKLSFFLGVMSWTFSYSLTFQKYRLHTRRPATPAVTNGGENPQQPQFMVVEGIWMPSQDAANNRVYAPVAIQPPRSSPSGERSCRRCKSPATSSSALTPHILPMS